MLSKQWILHVYRVSLVAFGVLLYPAPVLAAGSVYALIVGINDYRDEQINDLRFAEADARAMQQVLVESGYVAEEDVLLLLGEDATYRNITTAFENHLVRQAKHPEDVVYFYYGGHGEEGMHIKRGATYYLLPQDVQTGNLLSTAIEKGVIEFLWGAIGAERKVFISDACHSGGLKNMRLLSAKGLETIVSNITLAASEADQLSWELDRVGHGIFTYALTQGLAGAADTIERDGVISGLELHQYLDGTVQQLANEIGQVQRPVVEWHGAEPRRVFLHNKPIKRLPKKQLVQAPLMPIVKERIEKKEPSIIEVEMIFNHRHRPPKVLVAFQDDGVEGNLASSAEKAMEQRFQEVSEAFDFVTVSQTPQALLIPLGFGNPAADVAAVGRAAGADLVISGHFIAASLTEALESKLGTAISTYESRSRVRVIDSATGSVWLVEEARGQGASPAKGLALEEAVTESAAKLADQLMAPLLEGWIEARQSRPAGLLTVQGVVSYGQKQAVESALEGLESLTSALKWRGYGASTAYYEFAGHTDPKRVLALIDKEGLGAMKIANVQANADRLKLYLQHDEER